MKVIAAILCLAAAANAASVFPVESSVVKSDRVGDNFSYSIHQNQGYAAVDSVYPYQVKSDKVPAATAYVSPAEYKHVVNVAPVEVKHVVPVAQTEYKHVLPIAPVEVKATEYKQVYPITPVEIKATEYKQVVPIAPVQVKATEYKQVVPIAPVQVKAAEYKHVIPAATYVSSPVKSYVQSAGVVSPVQTVSYVQPSAAYVPAVSYSHDAAVPITYGANVYPYSYAPYSYPYISSQKIY